MKPYIPRIARDRDTRFWQRSVNVLIRARRATELASLSAPNLIDQSRHIVNGQHLSRTEWRLFEYLLEHPNQCLAYERIYGYMWHDPRLDVVHLLRNYIHSLRKKTPFQIITHHQLGVELILNA